MSHNDSRFLPEVLPADVRQAELVDLVARFTPSDGIHETAVTRLQLIRASAPAQGLPSVYEPGLVFVVQGRKQAMLGGEVYRYDPLNYLVISVSLPVVGRILEATPDKPYLCVRLNIDPRELAALVFEADASAAAAGKRGHGTLATTQRGVHVARVSDPLMDAVLRLLRLLRAPADAAVLAPLAVREIYYRVLTGELGARLRALTLVDSHAHRIARVIDVLMRQYDQPIRIEALADTAHMSASSLHHHFKQVTAMSPLQFQKQLRLHHARRLMLTEGIEAAAAGHRVGYESPSQFSREYRRLFGAPPRAEIEQMRSGAGA
jgi:AraC-like DNA-binding protein